jgi:hypothetical protein
MRAAGIMILGCEDCNGAWGACVGSQEKTARRSGGRWWRFDGEEMKTGRHFE